MELYQLRTFVAVAEEGHLTRAAERLFISQPAVSAHVKALEEELGVALFMRSARGMQLTREGLALKPRAEAALRSVGDFLSEARALREHVSGELKLALNSDPDLLRVRPLMDALRTAHPGLRVHLMQSMSKLIVEDVRTGKLDGGFAYLGEPLQGQQEQELTGLRLASTTLHVVCPPAWAVRLAACTWADVAAEPWVWYSDNCPCRPLLVRKLGALAQNINKIAVTDTESTLKALVADGAGLGLLGRHEAEAWERDGEVCILSSLEGLPIDIHFLHRRDRSADPAILAVRQALAEVWELALAVPPAPAEAEAC
ncbi:MAG TPA: LysR family transcriptional regulator [Humidesulfovibrio sp.]|uniref:LysR family transcriptional regulator n=1 Tax=Humidesulfovibrio sp. TaxID=2910988 RepID=UPI002BFF331F|nr:LysR family transcriptional regulator [Humidesulfovibrio sp.]HWR04702.1 LysR family transcriptional regulator [Humidesulfovibrio sp.]